MQANEIREILNDIEYRGWEFKLSEVHRYGRMWLQVRFVAYDENERDMVPQHGRKWMLSKWMTKSEIVQTALKAVLTAEEHEARERFKYRGRRIFGPHIDIDRLYEVCEEEDKRPPVG